LCFKKISVERQKATLGHGYEREREHEHARECEGNVNVNEKINMNKNMYNVHKGIIGYTEK
jgi:hypothetical protein